MIQGERGNNFDNRGKSRSKSRSCKTVECCYLHKKGYFKKYCEKFKVDQKEGKQPNNTTIAGVETENNDAELLLVYIGNTISDSWILNSDCPFHMCANRDWFDT